VPERVDRDRHLLVDLRAHERRRRLGRLHGLAPRLDIIGQETRGLAKTAGVVDAAGPVEVANRNGDVQPAARESARRRAPFLFEAFPIGEPEGCENRVLRRIGVLTPFTRRDVLRTRPSILTRD
jgi:hypothetical protein